jgi:hypothetical protein
MTTAHPAASELSRVSTDEANDRQSEVGPNGPSADLRLLQANGVRCDKSGADRRARTGPWQVDALETPGWWLALTSCAVHERIYDLVSRRAIPHRKEGSRVLFKLSHVDRGSRAALRSARRRSRGAPHSRGCRTSHTVRIEGKGLASRALRPSLDALWIRLFLLGASSEERRRARCGRFARSRGPEPHLSAVSLQRQLRRHTHDRASKPAPCVPRCLPWFRWRAHHDCEASREMPRPRAEITQSA